LLVEVAARLAAELGDASPPIYISANMQGAAEHNHRLVEQWRKRNPHL
jgi:uncharacterized phosphosugar-binding protein